MGELGTAPTLQAAFAKLGAALATLEEPDWPPSSAALPVRLVRLEVEVEAEVEPLHWLQHQTMYPRVYFSNQHKTLRAARAQGRDQHQKGRPKGRARQHVLP